MGQRCRRYGLDNRLRQWRLDGFRLRNRGRFWHRLHGRLCRRDADGGLRGTGAGGTARAGQGQALHQLHRVIVFGAAVRVAQAKIEYSGCRVLQKRIDDVRAYFMADRIALGVFHKMLGEPAGRIGPLLAVLQVVIVLVALNGKFQITCVMLPAAYLEKAMAGNRACKR